MSLPLSGSQTVGPFFSIGLSPLTCAAVASRVYGDSVIVEGQLLDGSGMPIPDGFIEVWQADEHGVYLASQPANTPDQACGFGRISTAPDGRFRFSTVKPGAVPYSATRMQAPHLLILVYMRGLLRNVVTRMYFPDEPANAIDPILQLVPPDRRSTLVAQTGPEPSLHWDIVMRQQEGNAKQETVFFAW